MTDVDPTGHALTRMAQRGIRFTDIDVIMAVGTEVKDGILVRRKDVEMAERCLREAIKALRRVEGKRLVMADGQLLTAYHARGGVQRRLLRKQR